MAEQSDSALKPMDRRKPRVGWYCPFVLPVLKKHERIEWVQIEPLTYPNGNIGALKLCRKMTAAWELIRMHSVDALVIADCCNLSHWMYDLFIAETREIPVHPLRVYRKVSCFSSMIAEEWNRLERWSSEVALNLPANRDESRRLAQSPAEYRGTSSSTIWCTLRQEEWEEISRLSPRHAFEFLVQKVCCPRLMAEDGDRPAYRFYKENARQLEETCDRECVPQNYFLTLARGDPKA